VQSLELPDLNITSLNIDSDRAKHDLRLELEESEEGLKGSFGYRVDLFNPETIARIAEHFEILLRQITTHPNTKISSLAEILAEANKQQQLIQEKELEKASRQKFKMTKRKSISSV
jgi:non-ribosomal peptide synthetase component F